MFYFRKSRKWNYSRGPLKRLLLQQSAVDESLRCFEPIMKPKLSPISRSRDIPLQFEEECSIRGIQSRIWGLKENLGDRCQSEINHHHHHLQRKKAPTDCMDATHNCICVLLVFVLLYSMYLYLKSWRELERDANLITLRMYSSHPYLFLCFGFICILYLVHLYLKSWREFERDANLRSIRPHRCHSGARTTRHNWSMKSILADQEK